MMKVTKTTFNEIAASREEKARSKYPVVQRQLKNGNWGKPYTVPYYTEEEVVERLEELNPGCHYRLAQ